MTEAGMEYYDTILEAVGNTPLVRLRKVVQGVRALVLAKLEYLNPGRSVKDRIGVAIIEEAERLGQIAPGGTIVEATSGNTGMGLALAAAVKGYKTVFAIPDKMSDEKIRSLRALGAEVIVTPTAVPHDSPESYTEVAKRIVMETPNAILANQYENPENPDSHYRTTGPEIWRQTGGRITHFVCGIGTGGTITGTARFLKEKDPSIQVIGVDPHGSVLREVFTTGKSTPTLKTYKVEGIGQDYVPAVLDFHTIDDVIDVGDRESFLMARRLTREEGIMAGGSSGSAVAALSRIADRLAASDVVVVLLPDSGERYLSKLYNDDWMRENGFLRPERITVRYLLQSKPPATQRLVATEPGAPVRKALHLMREHDVSQLPVLKDGTPVGAVFDNELMTAVMETPALIDAPVERVMGASFATVDTEAGVDEVLHRMRDKRNYAVLAEEGGTIRGILTRYDVIEFLGR